MAQPLLSLCMIVKNEQAMLPDLLSSVAGLWDELIVADTGSTDQSVKVLTAAGATVLHHVWDDDFAAARNASLAIATGRWILFLDADERVTPALTTQIRSLLTDDQAGAATVVMRNRLPGGHHRDANLLRLFRNDPAIRFRHRIHEDVLEDVEVFLEREGLALRHLGGVVEHLGYVREVAAGRDKKQRDHDLLRRTLAEDPADFYCWFKLLELARFWEDNDLWSAVATEVAPRLTSALAPKQIAQLQRNPWSGELAALISQGAFPDAAESLAWLDKWQDRIRPAAAWQLRRALLLESLGRFHEADEVFGVCLAERQAAGSHHRARALMGRCRLAAHKQDLPNALTLATEAVEASPADAEALLAMVTFTKMAEGPDRLDDFVRQHHRAHPAAGAALAEVLLESGHVIPALELLTELAETEPPLAMGLLTCALALGRDVDLNVDLDQVTADAAFQRWIRILWTSRQTELMSVFAESCGGVAEVFPWLEKYLAAETARLRA